MPAVQVTSHLHAWTALPVPTNITCRRARVKAGSGTRMSSGTGDQSPPCMDSCLDLSSSTCNICGDRESCPCMEVTGHLYRWSRHPSTGTALTSMGSSTCNICGDRESCPCMEVTGHLYRCHPSTTACLDPGSSTCNICGDRESCPCMEVTGHLYRCILVPLPDPGSSTCNICGDRESCPCMEVTGHLYRSRHPSTGTALTRALLHVIFVEEGTGY